MPRTVESKAIAAQIVRSGTSVGANYRACCKARSRAEFVAKIGIAEEEADETGYWLELIIDTDMMPAARINDLLQESKELTAILARSRQSAAAKLPRRKSK